MPVIDTVKFIAPTQTASLTDDQINTAIELAAARISACIWGDLYSQGVAYLAAHLLALRERASSGGGGAVGPVTQEMAGRVQISYAVPQGWDGDGLRSTPFGQDFLDLRRKLPGTRMFNTGFDDICPDGIDEYDGGY